MKPGVSILRGLRQAIRWACGERVPVRCTGAERDSRRRKVLDDLIEAEMEDGLYDREALGMLREVVKQ